MEKGRYSFGWRKIKRILQKTGGKCYYCGIDLPKDKENLDEYGQSYSSVRNWDIDHLTPISKGGTNHDDNLVPACKTCNNKKSNMTADEFMAGKL